MFGTSDECHENTFSTPGGTERGTVGTKTSKSAFRVRLALTGASLLLSVAASLARLDLLTRTVSPTERDLSNR